MGNKGVFKHNLRMVGRTGLFICLTIMGASQVEAAIPRSTTLGPQPKSFAVFVANYNDTGSDVVGGVAGTAFFTSTSKALTAYHVLQKGSFKPRQGYQKVRIWLVHEGQPAIELKATMLKETPDRDLVEIDFPKQAVNSEFVFSRISKRESLETPQVEVITEGFLANSTGPVLAREGKDIVIQSVPRLQRLIQHGQLLRMAKVELRASDVNLKSAPCLQVSYKPVVGISGGPVLLNGQLIGMNSFADPSGQSSWAQEL